MICKLSYCIVCNDDRLSFRSPSLLKTLIMFMQIQLLVESAYLHVMINVTIPRANITQLFFGIAKTHKRIVSNIDISILTLSFEVGRFSKTALEFMMQHVNTTNITLRMTVLLLKTVWYFNGR